MPTPNDELQRAHALLQDGNLRDAEEAYRKVLQRARSVMDVRTERLARRGMGELKLRSGDLNEALLYFTEALNISRAQKDKILLVEDLCEVGNVFRSLRNYSEAVWNLFEALDVVRSVGERALEAKVLVCLGKTYMALGELEPAREVLYGAIHLLTKYDPKALREAEELFAEVETKLAHSIERPRE